MADPTDSEVSLLDDELDLLLAEGGGGLPVAGSGAVGFVAGYGGGGPVAGSQPFTFGVTRWPGKPQTGLLSVQQVDQVCFLLVLTLLIVLTVLFCVLTVL